MGILPEPHFHCEEAAYTRLEGIVWPNGPVCPHCGGTDRITAVRGKTARAGLKRCGGCKRQFRATVKTVFESSHIKLHLWFQAAHLMASSKKGISAHQLHRTLKITYKSAWFMCHRLREAMRSGDPAIPMGGAGKIVEADETYSGTIPKVEIMPRVAGKSAGGRFEFSYNNRVAPGVQDSARAEVALRGTIKKRLTYRDSSAGGA